MRFPLSRRHYMFEVKLAFAAGIAALTAAVCTAGAPETVPGYFVQTGSQWRGQGSRVPVSISGSAVQIGAAILSHEGAQDRMPAPEITGAARWYGHGEAKMTRLAVRLRWRYLYPGIDLLMRFEGGSLKSDYLVEPGADPAAIRIRIEGPEAPVLDAGDLLLGEHRQAAPVAWQDHPDGRRISVQAAWKLEGSVAGFRIGPHDPTLPLVIDPYTIAFAKWLGGSALDTIRAITRDSAGNVYVGGVTESADFPSGSLRPRDIGAEAFVIKLDAANNIVWATWLGGYAHDEVTAVAAHHAGGVVVGGYTSSPDFPTANAAWPSWRGGSTDAFAIRLDSAGALVFSTFLGGAGTDKAWGVAVPAGQALWVVGETDSGDFPSLGEISGAARGGTEAFATRLSVHGSPLSSTKLGGSGADRAYAAATDAASELYITGTTESVDFPVVAPFQAASAGAPDAFVAKLAWDGSVLRYSSYLGGPPRETALPEEGSAIAVDGSGAAWVGGTTASFAFPRVAALQQTFGGGVTDAFIARVAPGGTSLLFSTYIGGNGTDQAAAVALGSDAVWIAGSTTSTDLPVTAQAQSGSGSSWDGFVAAYSHGSNSRVYSGYLGGSGSDTITAAAASGTSLFLAGNSSSVALLSTGSPRGLIDGYIARLDTLPSAVQITPSVTSGRYGVAGAGCEPGTYSGTRVFTWAHNATCTVTVPTPQATGGTRLNFTGWSDGATQNPRTISVNSTSAQFFPNFSVEQQLTMAVAPAGAGTSASSPSPAGGWYPQGSTVTLTAQPASGYRFSNWSGSTASSSGTVSFAITSAGAVTANFACAYTLTSGTAVSAAQAGGSYTINVSTGAGCAWTASGASWVTISSGTAGTGNGSVTIAVAANSGPSRSVAINVAGQVVTVTQNTTASYATSIEGVAWTVTGSGCQPGSYAGTKTLTWTAGSSCTVAMSNSVATDTRTVFVQWQDGSTASSRVFVASSSATYKATYKTEHRVQAAAGPGGSVTPAGTSWHVAGSTATITAVPVSGYRFAGWTGSITAQANPLSMAVTGPLTVSASFAADVVPVTIDGVSWTTSGAGCSAGSYAGKQTLNWVRNAACTVAMNAATAGETRQAFTKWLDGPTTSTRIITATPGAAYSATYRTEYRVLVSLSTGGSATPTESWHVPGATVTLSATAQPGYRFRRWLGALNTVANPVQVQVDAPQSILAA
ncbi:MAG TPA: SBBP repeat-containing protein, partial [Bryobacteraceae bacterium]|nr:SBBP repeat-containing protein [Bryobacteraceae bacterium]